MNKATLTAEQARRVYQVLVAHCGAGRDSEEAFVTAFTGDVPRAAPAEWQFQGRQNQVGKFRFPAFIVQMPATAQGAMELAVADQALAALKENFGVDPLCYGFVLGSPVRHVKGGEVGYVTELDADHDLDGITTTRVVWGATSYEDALATPREDSDIQWTHKLVVAYPEHE